MSATTATPTVTAVADTAVAALTAAEPELVGVARAGSLVPALDEGLLLHAGPPLDRQQLPGPTRGAVAGALLLEGRAADPDAALAAIARGGIALEPAHHHGAVGPMAGVISASMPVFVVRDRGTGATAFATINEGLGRVLRFGAYGPEVIDRLRWMADVLAPVLGRMLDRAGAVPLRPLLAEGLLRGDECHNRNKASTAQFVRRIAADVVEAAEDTARAAEVLRFVSANDHFFLNLSMAACKAATLAVGVVPGSPVVTAIASNGVEVGIRIAAEPGRWFTAPAPQPAEGRWLGGATPADAAPLLGDSFVTEVNGLGAFAAAAAPAISTYIGGSVRALAAAAAEMYAITAAEHPVFKVAHQDYRGTPVGIDVTKVVATGIAPVVNAGFADRRAGVGQVGAGLVRLPMACFAAAAASLAGTGR